jgi:hypothetical protein
MLAQPGNDPIGRRRRARERLRGLDDRGALRGRSLDQL